MSGGENHLFTFSGSANPAATVGAEAQIDHLKFKFGLKKSDTVGAWFRLRVRAVLEDPERFKLILETQSERFAFLSLSLATLLLTLSFAGQRRFFIFDRTIFALHSLSFQGLLFSGSSLGGMNMATAVADPHRRASPFLPPHARILPNGPPRGAPANSAARHRVRDRDSSSQCCCLSLSA